MRIGKERQAWDVLGVDERIEAQGRRAAIRIDIVGCVCVFLCLRLFDTQKSLRLHIA